MGDHRQDRGRGGAAWLLLAAVLVLLGRCDTVEPEGPPRLVVEGYLDAGKPLPLLTLRQTRPLDVPYPDDATTAVADAEVQVALDGEAVAYRAVPGRPGQYAPADVVPGRTVPARAAFRLDVRWRNRQAQAEGTVPPPIRIDSVQVRVPPEPVQAILLDSLYLTDSLDVGVQEGYIYPVEVSLWWRTEAAADSLYWIQTRLRPYTSFSSTVVDFFLRPEQVLQEQTIPRDPAGRRRWTGVYAVPVAAADAPLPSHNLQVALLRSGRDYARFAVSRDAPDRREPISNVTGALGIFAGISVDSLRVRVDGP